MWPAPSTSRAITDPSSPTVWSWLGSASSLTHTARVNPLVGSMVFGCGTLA